MKDLPPGPRAAGPLENPPEKPTWSSRGYLPHFDAADTWQSITYRLADSMPAHVIESIERELDAVPDDQRNTERRKRLEAWINAGHGSCMLRRDDVAALILENWQRFAGECYDLGPWVIMPNHVHVLIRVNPGFSLATIIGSWKSYTAKRIAALTDMAPPVWWPDYWDRYIRDDNHWIGTRRYIDHNPVAAGLVPEPADWRWSSASFENRMRPESRGHEITPGP